MQKWKRIEPTRTYKASYKTLVDKTFILPDGKTYTPTTIGTEHGEGAGVLALTSYNKVIIARQFRPGPEMIMDELPGGKVEPGEDKTLAAARELREDTRYVAGDITFLGTAHYDSYTNTRRHCFLATDCRLLSQGTEHDEHEFIEVHLVSIDEAITIAKEGRMTDPSAVLMAYDRLMKLKE